MQKITIEETVKYSKNLNVLYVEDDVDLQKHSKELFDALFKSVSTADNGAEALKKYKDEPFDVVISDVKMPIMNGLKLTQEIKNIDPRQSVIITSAYDDSDDLLKFINLNISQFIQKPVKTETMLRTIYEVSKNIVNENMIETYRKELEKTNKTLQDKNEELQSLVRILDSKLIQISKDSKTQKSGFDFKNLEITQSDLNELKELETDISGAAVLISLSNKLTISNVKILGAMFSSYSKILSNHSNYEELTTHIEKLGELLNHAPKNFIKRVEDISILLESFIYVLRMWRKNIVEKEVRKAFELHTSMINDVDTIISIIDGTEDDIQGEMGFF